MIQVFYIHCKSFLFLNKAMLLEKGNKSEIC